MYITLNFSYIEAIRLVKVRAEAMQLASEIVPSGMMTVFYDPDSKLNYACLQAKEWCLQRGIENPECCVANYLYPHCKVVAGHLEVQYKDIPSYVLFLYICLEH
jgi:[acyl-carrier-protein] S-malonyltransferase